MLLRDLRYIQAWMLTAIIRPSVRRKKRVRFLDSISIVEVADQDFKGLEEVIAATKVGKETL
jgi:hypothetical protein